MALSRAIAALVLVHVAGCVNIGPSVTNALTGIPPEPTTKVLFASWHRALVMGADRTYQPYEGSGPVADPSAGRIYLGTSTGRFYALRSQDGNVVWSHDTGESIHSVPALSEDGSTVYFGNESGVLTALDAATGVPEWTYQATAEIRCTPLVHKQIVVVRDVRGKVHAVDGRNGSSLWLYRSEPPEGYTLASSVGVSLAKGRVLTGFTDGTAVALKLLDGSRSWEADLAEFLPGDMGMGAQKYDVNTTPVVLSSATALFSSYNGGLFAMDTLTGSIAWRRGDLDRVSGMTATKTRIFVARSSYGVAALDMDGDSLWYSHFPSGTLSDPVAYKGRVYVTDSRSGLVVLSGATGQVLDRYTPAWGATSRPMVVSGRAFVFSNGGHLFTFGLGQH